MEEAKNRLYRTCPYCGANLDPGERCDCERERMHPLPRDGLRATCPYFRQRIDYQGDYRIQCMTRQQGSLLNKQDGLFYLSREERDAEYTRRCCQGGYCWIRDTWADEE